MERCESSASSSSSSNVADKTSNLSNNLPVADHLGYAPGSLAATLRRESMIPSLLENLLRNTTTARIYSNENQCVVT